jgi:hypothetical protein
MPLLALEEALLLLDVVVVPLDVPLLPELALEEWLADEVEDPPPPSLTAELGPLHARLPSTSATGNIQRARSCRSMMRAEVCMWNKCPEP